MKVLEDIEVSKKIEEIYEQCWQELDNKIARDVEEHQRNVLSSTQYKDEIKYLNKITTDYFKTLNLIGIYSMRGSEIYDNCLTISIIDELIESAVCASSLIEMGCFNIVKRDLRYLLELITKSAIVDFKCCDKSTLIEKIEYLKSNIPRSSIDAIDEFKLPFNDDLNQCFRDEIKNNYSNLSAFIHPSEKQHFERLNNCKRGNHIGFESTKMVTKINSLLFRTYDLILFLQFYCFGYSMSKDILKAILSVNSQWKYKKGKYMKAYIKILNLPL